MTTRQLSTIKFIDARDIWPAEDINFTPWLAEHITELGEALGLELNPDTTSTEVPVGNYRLDILAHDGGRAVAIENQLGETDHTHLGQLLTYMAGRDARVVVWIAGKFRDEHREALDLMNRLTDEETEFFGVVVEVLQIDNSHPAPHFKVVSAPNDWGKQNKATTTPGESGISQRYRQFFEALVDQLGNNLDNPRPRKVSGKSWLSFHTGYSGFDFGASFTNKGGTRRARVELYIDSKDKERNKAFFDELEAGKEEIESEIEGEFDWDRLDNKRACRIAVVHPGSIRDDEEKLAAICDWMAAKLPEFKNTFGPRIADLVD